MKRMLALSVLLIMLSSGCLSHERKSPDITPDVFRNPEAYVGENVTLYAGIIHNDSAIFGAFGILYADNSTYMLPVNGTAPECGRCSINATVMKTEFCGCEYAGCSGTGCMPPESANWTSLGTRLSSACEGKVVVMALGSLVQRSVFRCSEGSGKTVYYLQVLSARDISG